MRLAVVCLQDSGLYYIDAGEAGKEQNIGRQLLALRLADNTRDTQIFIKGNMSSLSRIYGKLGCRNHPPG